MYSLAQVLEQVAKAAAMLGETDGVRLDLGPEEGFVLVPSFLG